MGPPPMLLCLEEVTKDKGIFELELLRLAGPGLFLGDEPAKLR